MTGLGEIARSYFTDHLPCQRGLQAASVRSYRDAFKLFLVHSAEQSGKPVTRLTWADLGCDRVLEFLNWLEKERHNGVRTRNQRLAALRSFYRYAASRCPETLAEAQRVEAIPTKRCPPARTTYLERDEIEALFASLPDSGPLALRDRALLMLLYNSGARAQEAADLRVGDMDLDGPYRVRLHGKGDKWRICPLWPETADLLKRAVGKRIGDASAPVFASQSGRPLTRFGIYKAVCRHARARSGSRSDGTRGAISPHVFRHSTAVHLLEAGVELNVIGGWLGHVSLDTTNRYAEIGMRTKIAAVETCLPPVGGEAPKQPIGGWHKTPDLLDWLDSL